MFTQITTSIDLLKVEIEKELDYISMMRLNEQNPNMFAEYGGRTIGLTWALQEINKTQLDINEHITDILKNTTDGNYIAKMGVLEDENRVLRDKVYLLEQDIKRYKSMSDKNKTHPECFKEYSEQEVDDMIQEAYEKDGYEDFEGEE